VNIKKKIVKFNIFSFF